MFLERLAEWYLERRGRVVLPRLFIGLAIGGHAQAIKVLSDGTYDHFEVTTIARTNLIALNNSMFIDKTVLDNPSGAEYYMGKKVGPTGCEMGPTGAEGPTRK